MNRGGGEWNDVEWGRVVCVRGEEHGLGRS